MTSQELQALLGSNINRFRQLQSLTVERLAEGASISVGHMTDVIRGRKWVSAELIVRVAEALSIPVHHLFAPVEETGRSAELLVSEMGHELIGKVTTLIQETTQEYLKKGPTPQS